MDYYAFDTIFTKSVPHILEKIFFSLDYASYKSCCEVNKTWNDLLTSKWYVVMARSLFKTDVAEDEARLFFAICWRPGDVRKLLSNGILDVQEATNDYGVTPLGRVAEVGNINLVKLMLDKGCDIDKTDKYGNSPLHSAARWGHKNMVKLLVDEGAEVNLADATGRTPLHMAAMTGVKNTVQILLISGAQLNKTDHNGHTPLDVAAGEGHKYVTQFLKSRGASFGKSKAYIERERRLRALYFSPI